jgi:hypothetical protein
MNVKGTKITKITNALATLAIMLGMMLLPFFSSISSVYAQEEDIPADNSGEQEVATTSPTVESEITTATIVFEEEKPVEETSEENAAVETVQSESIEEVTEVISEELDEVVVEAIPEQESVEVEKILSEETTESADSEKEAELNAVVEDLADLGAVLLDENQEPVSLTSPEAVEILLAPDPYFVRGGVTHRFLTDCTGYPIDAFNTCTQTSTPIQDAVYDVRDNGLPTDSTIYVEFGTYNENVIITVDDLTLYGDPGGLTTEGAGPLAPTLDGAGLANRTGFYVDAVNVSIIGFIIQNFGSGIELVPSGNASFTAENNTIQDNDIGVYNKNAVPGIELHYNNFNNNILAIKNDDVRGLQYIQAQNNWWGCADGPIVQYLDKTETKHVLWSTKAEVDPANYPGCQVLYGENSKWNHQIQTDDYSPFKINLGGEIVEGCTDENALNFDVNANKDDASCEFEEETKKYNLLLDPYCVDVNGEPSLAWAIINPNNFNVDASWSLDSANGSGTLAPGTTFVGYTLDGPDGHTLNVSWGFGSGSQTSSELCAPVNEKKITDSQVQVVADIVENLLIPVTGAEFELSAMMPYAGSLLVGIGLFVKGLLGKNKK